LPALLEAGQKDYSLPQRTCPELWGWEQAAPELCRLVKPEMKPQGLVLTVLLVAGGYGRQAELAPGSNHASERARNIINQLEPENDLRLALERGYKGDGVHREWMDKMHEYGIRQASYVMRFVWKQEFKQIKITNQCFLKQYYQYETIIKDRKMLRQIRDGGLEKELRDAVFVRAKESLPRLMLNVAQTANVHPNRAEGTLYLNLLADGLLPILDQVPNIYWQFPRPSLNATVPRSPPECCARLISSPPDGFE
jgi:hypothetical protein